MIRGWECIWTSLNTCFLSNYCGKRHGILSLTKRDEFSKRCLHHPQRDLMVTGMVRAVWEVHRHFYRAEGWQTWIWAMCEHTRLSCRDSIGPWRGNVVSDCWRCMGGEGVGHPRHRESVSTRYTHRVHKNSMCKVWCFLKANKDFWEENSIIRALGDNLWGRDKKTN